MPKNEVHSQRDQLIEQYRAIGPAVLVAALRSQSRKTEARNDNNRPSILAIKKTR